MYKTYYKDNRWTVATLSETNNIYIICETCGGLPLLPIRKKCLRCRTRIPYVVQRLAKAYETITKVTI